MQFKKLSLVIKTRTIKINKIKPNESEPNVVLENEVLFVITCIYTLLH